MVGQPEPASQARNDVISQRDTTNREINHMQTGGEDLTWRHFCGGNTDSDGTEESCVEFAEQGPTVILRDSKDPDTATLKFTQAEITSFAEGWTSK